MEQCDVVLLPTFSHVEQWRKLHAPAGSHGLFAQRVTTFAAWIGDLWELHGDGRLIASALQRQVIMRLAFEQGAPEASGAPSPGMVKAAAKCVRDASGAPQFEQALALVWSGQLPSGLTDREGAFLKVMARYAELLASANLVELGQAAMALARSSERVFERRLSVLLSQSDPPGWIIQAFFAACPQLGLHIDEASSTSGVGRMPEGVGLRFGFPSGRYAQPALVADLLREMAARGLAAPQSSGGASAHPLAPVEGLQALSAVIACKDPLALAEQLEGSLAGLGASLRVQAQLPFAATDFGRQFMALYRAVAGDAGFKEDVSDAARPPFSGFSPKRAREIDGSLRADRIARLTDVLASLRAESDTFSQLEELASDPDADILLGVFEQIARQAPDRSSAWKAAQLAAASAMRSCTAAARGVGAGMPAAVSALESAAISVSFKSAGAPSPAEGEGGECPGPLQVLVTTQSRAAQMGEGACEILVLGDMTSEDFPVADKETAEGVLLGKLGLAPFDSALSRSRREFAALQRLARKSMVCLRPLNDWDGNPTYPSAMLQELIDAYRPDAPSSDDIDKQTGLPAHMLEGSLHRGEELLVANARVASTADAAWPLACVEQRDIGFMAPDAVGKVALPRRGAHGRALGFSPSPSQVESYISCPHRWFAQSRLRLETLDEGFGPLERGSFAHACLQRFYREFMEAGHAKVSPDNLDQARALMREVCAREQAAQCELEPRSGRFVAADQLEERQVEACMHDLVSYLDFEARFLPGFKPLHLEHGIAPEDGVCYAGAPFIGTVDRIDVDDAGNAVIIDYKGSLNSSHEIARKNAADPGKVQARMYAQVVQRQLGLRVVGALYVSYGARSGCSGAYDGLSLDAAHLPFMKHDNCRLGAGGATLDALVHPELSSLSFAQVLDETERIVARVVERMRAGDVQPDPLSGDVCSLCPIASCPKRGA